MFFANFQILGPLGCQGWVVIPQNVKKVKITAPYCTFHTLVFGKFMVLVFDVEILKDKFIIVSIALANFLQSSSLTESLDAEKIHRNVHVMSGFQKVFASGIM
jgi:hypothetical protein